jgi:signal transduction histidine kinase
MPTVVASRLALLTGGVIIALWLAGTLLWATSESRLIFDRNLTFSPGQVATSIEEAGGVSTFELQISLVYLFVAVLGVLVAARHPGNPVGWLLVATGAPVAFRWFVNGLLAQAMETTVPPAPLPLELATVLWVSHWITVTTAGTLAPILLLFPNGTLPSARWGIALAIALVGFVLVTIVRMFAPEALRGWPFMLNPYGWPGSTDTMRLIIRIGPLCLTMGVVLGALSLVMRARHAAPEERQQVKWLAYGGSLLALSFPAAALGTIRGSELGIWQPALQAVNIYGTLAFAACLAIAILRHRLYDIDLLINKTLVYGVLAVLITAVYVGTVVGLGHMISRLEESSLALSLVVTALAAVAFQPVRERVQQVVDRLVYGERANPYDVLASFARRVADSLSVEEVLPQMAEVAGTGVGAARSRVRVFLPDGGEHAAAWPPQSGASDEPFLRVVPVAHQGERVGEISVDKPAGEDLTHAEEKLLADLASEAGPALSNVRLTEELRANLRALVAQAVELRASRQRIVAAQDAARRQLERDVHDGAQQHLVALAVTLRLAWQTAAKDPSKLDPLFEQLTAQAADALETLRALARGLFPAVLGDRGLAVALQSYLSRTYPEAEFDAQALEGARFAPDVEAGVYFCCLEALQNAGKHAAGAPVAVRLNRTNGWLSFEVQDAGPGFDVSGTPRGSGLLNMADRMAALGGTLHVTSTPGKGTTITGGVPTAAGAAAGNR